MLEEGDYDTEDAATIGYIITIFFDKSYRTNLDGSNWLNIQKDGSTKNDWTEYGYYIADPSNRNTSMYMYDLVYSNDEDERSE